MSEHERKEETQRCNAGAAVARRGSERRAYCHCALSHAGSCRNAHKTLLPVCPRRQHDSEEEAEGDAPGGGGAQQRW